MDETWTKLGRSMDKRLYYRLCVSCRIDTWQIVYLLYEDACPIMGNSVVTDVQFGHLFLVCIKYDALQQVNCGLFRKIPPCS